MSRARRPRLLLQCGDSCPPAARLRGSIPKVENEFGASQHRTDHFPLHADAAAVDDAQGLESQAMGLRQILFHHGLYVSRGNGMQIENIRDGYPNRFRFHVL